MKSNEPRTEKEFDAWMKEHLKENEELRKVFEEDPEKYELYKRKWFDALWPDASGGRG